MDHIVYKFNKSVLLLFLVPLFAFSQNTVFTPEQEALVQEVVNKIKTTPEKDINFELFINDLNVALDKAPYHPDLLYELFRVYTYGQTDSNLVSKYCQRLDQTYLQNHQMLLVEFCAACYSATEELDLLYNIIPIINDQKSKDLYNAFYYLETENQTKAEEFVLATVENHYKLKTLAFFKDYIFKKYIKYLASIKALSRMYEIMITYKDQLESYNLDIETYFVLIETAIIKNNYRLAEDLIRYCSASSFENFRYMSIAKAYLYSLNGNQGLAVGFLETALNLDDSAFEVILSETGGFNVYAVYLKTINNLRDYDTKVHLVTQMLDFFKGKPLFTLQTKLYRSVLFASRDLEQAQVILDACKENLSPPQYNSFRSLIEIENELHKEDPDFKLVDKIIQDFKSVLDEEMFLKVKYNFQNSVSIDKNEAFFGVEQMIKDLDRLLEISSNEEEKLEYTIEKIKTLAIIDLDGALVELDKLGVIKDSDKASFIEKNFTAKTKEIDRPIKGIKRFTGLSSLFLDFINRVKATN